MQVHPIAANAPYRSLKRSLKIVFGAGLTCLLVLAPALHFAAESSWSQSLTIAGYAALAAMTLLAIGIAGLRLGDWLAGRRRHGIRAPADSPTRRAARAAMLQTLDAVEAELRRIGYWTAEPPPAMDAFRSGQARSYLDAPTFELWLQCVFLPHARDAVTNDRLPASSSVGVFAMRQYDYHSVVEEAQPLLALLRQFDDQANRYVGHDPLMPTMG